MLMCLQVVKLKEKSGAVSIVLSCFFSLLLLAYKLHFNNGFIP